MTEPFSFKALADQVRVGPCRPGEGGPQVRPMRGQSRLLAQSGAAHAQPVPNASTARCGTCAACSNRQRSQVGLMGALSQPPAQGGQQQRGLREERAASFTKLWSEAT